MTNAIIRASAATAAAALLCLSAAAVEYGETPTPENYSDIQPAAEPASAYSEAQAVGALDAANQAEIEAAQLAQDRSSNEDVKDFARRMAADHGDARDRLQKIGITAAGSDASRMFKERARLSSRRLSRLSGPAFDREYVAAQVDDHALLLSKIDEKLIPAAKTGELAKFLREVRPLVAAHLEHARRLKTELGTR